MEVHANHVCTEQFPSLRSIMMNPTHICLDSTVACLLSLCLAVMSRKTTGCLVAHVFIYNFIYSFI